MVSISYERHTLLVNMPYDRDCIEEIKQTIPAEKAELRPYLRVTEPN